MNFVYISPQFPKTNWEFCDRLKKKWSKYIRDSRY